MCFCRCRRVAAAACHTNHRGDGAPDAVAATARHSIPVRRRTAGRRMPPLWFNFLSFPEEAACSLSLARAAFYQHRSPHTPRNGVVVRSVIILCELRPPFRCGAAHKTRQHHGAGPARAQHASDAAELTRLDDADFREAHCLESGTEARVATGRLCGDARYFVVRCARPGRLRATQQMPFAAFQELRRQLGEQAALVKSPFPARRRRRRDASRRSFFRASVDAAAADRARARALEAWLGEVVQLASGARWRRARAGPCATRCSTTSAPSSSRRRRRPRRGD